MDKTLMNTNIYNNDNIFLCVAYSFRTDINKTVKPRYIKLRNVIVARLAYQFHVMVPLWDSGALIVPRLFGTTSNF